MIEVKDKSGYILDWLKMLLEQYQLEEKEDISNISYYYFRDHDYKDIDSYNILRGLMAAVELSVEWGTTVNKEKLLKKYILKKRIYLKKIYYDFLKYLKYHSELFQKIENTIVQEYYGGKCNKKLIFDIVCDRHGEELVLSFKDFILKWRYEYPTTVLDMKEIQSLKRIVKVYRNPDLYYEEVFNKNHIMHLMSLTYNSEFYYHIFDFFSWLVKSNVDVTISKKELELKIQSYITKKNLQFNKKLYYILLRSFYGKEYLVNFLWFFRGQAKNRNLNYQRYVDVFSHGFLLLQHDDDYKEIKIKSWNSLQNITDNILDIYYSNNELKGKLSGYGVLKKIEELKVPIDELPALLVWREDINEYRLINMKNLNRESYIKIVVAYVKSVQTYISSGEVDKELIFKNSVEKAITEVDGILFKERGLTMNYTNNNYGKQQGNFGHFGHIEDSVLVINEQEELDYSTLDSKKISELKTIVEKILLLNVEGLEKSDKLEITLELQRLIEVFEKEDTTEIEKNQGALKWKQFFKNNTQRVLILMGAVADIITISSPLLKFLGMPSK